MSTLTPEDRARLRDLASRATPGPWEAEWDLSEGELTVSAGTAQTKWDSDSGTPPSTYNTTDRILEWDDVWPEDGGEQREADADFIVAARTAVPALLDALDEAEAAVERVREMHKPLPEYQHIIACSCGWWSHDDCPHVRALDGDA